jgi:sporulation protein YlmC with PRC-barrel domain
LCLTIRDCRGADRQTRINDIGNDLGEISDLRFDPKKGIDEGLVLSEREEAPASLLGAGSYAAIFGSK